jgi:5-methylcytosine-specific restriction endonuclease McrA
MIETPPMDSAMMDDSIPGRTCSRCGKQKPATREFFGSTPSGGLRGYCRACMNAASRSYEANNKDQRKQRDAKRAESGSGARATFDLQAKRSLFQKQGGICPCCMTPIGRPHDGEVDHVTPLARGGKHHPSNFMLAHAQCNKEKHNKTLSEHWEWRLRVGLDSENVGRKHGLA